MALMPVFQAEAFENVYIFECFFICFSADIIINGEGLHNLLIFIKGEEK